MSATLVIGLGNGLRGDDAVGPLVLAQLRPLHLRDVEFLESPADNLSLVDAWRGRDRVIVVDACEDAARQVGSVVILEDALRHNRALAGMRHPASSHLLDLQQAIAMSQPLGCAPRSLSIFAIVAGSFAMGAAPDPRVVDAVQRLADGLAVLLSAAGGRLTEQQDVAAIVTQQL